MNERGQVTVLVAGMTMVVFAVAGLAVDGTRAFVYRRTLQSAADAAALAAAGELDKHAYYVTGGRNVVVDPARATSIAHRMLNDRGLRVSAAVDVTRDRATIVLRGRVDAMFLRLVGFDRIPVAVEAVAEPVTGAD